MGPVSVAGSPRQPYKFARKCYKIPEGIPCDNPTSLTVDSVGVNEAYLSWISPVGTDHTVVRYSLVGSGIWNSTTTSSSNIALTGLATYAPYEWSLLAFCEATGLNNSDTISGNLDTSCLNVNSKYLYLFGILIDSPLLIFFVFASTLALNNKLRTKIAKSFFILLIWFN